MKHTLPIVISVVAFLAAACGSAIASPTPLPAAPAASPSPDPCARENIPGGIAAINKLMRAFDDEAELASHVPQSQLSVHIAALQSIRRDAEDQSEPACLRRLKQLQISHMNAVIGTLMTFLGGGDQQAVKDGVRAAQQFHDAYLVEMAGVLGITAVVVTPAPTRPAAGATPLATTEAGAASTSGPTAAASSGIVAINPGPNPVYLKEAASETSATVATLAAGEQAPALGMTPDGMWYQVVVPGQPWITAYVLVSQVELGNANP